MQWGCPTKIVKWVATEHKKGIYFLKKKTEDRKQKNEVYI